MTLVVPELSLVLLVGASGAGKSTFARAHFGRFETVSSDFCRGLVANDENDQSATGPAFETLRFVVAQRLRRGLLTVVDATNVQPEARAPLLAIARRHDVPAVAVVLDLPADVCEERNRTRPDRTLDVEVVRRHLAQLRRSLDAIEREGFALVHVLRSEADVAAAEVVRRPLGVDRRWDRGPFDVVGDVHGCGDELDALLASLGWARDAAGVPRHPEGRRAVFLGDLADRGPRVPHVLRTVMDMADAGSALAVPGNHDVKLVKALRGRAVQPTHGLASTLAQLDGEPPAFRDRVRDFLAALPSHLLLDGGALVVAHAGLEERMHGRASERVRTFALYGETTGETDELGLPVRGDWAARYGGAAHVVYGHTPVARPEWRNRTLDVDTGCVFGGRLTALRWPERELVGVPALRAYAEPARPFLPAADAVPDATA